MCIKHFKKKNCMMHWPCFGRCVTSKMHSILYKCVNCGCGFHSASDVLICVIAGYCALSLFLNGQCILFT